MLSTISTSTDLKSFISNVKNFYKHEKNYCNFVGDLGEVFCELYFLFNKDIYDIKNYYQRKIVPTDILKKIKLEKEDQGTDAIIKHNDDKFSFVQCKFRSDIEESLLRESVSNMGLEFYTGQKENPSIFKICIYLAQ